MRWLLPFFLMRHVLAGALILVPVLGLAPRPAAADDAEEAEAHFLKGAEMAASGDCAHAVDELKASYDLKPVPIVLYNIGVCYDALDKKARAVTYYRLFLLAAGTEDEDKKASVAERIETLSEDVGSVSLSVSEDGAEILFDGELVGLTPIESIYADAGVLELTIRKAGFEEVRKKLVVLPGETTPAAVLMIRIHGGNAGHVADPAGGKRKTVPAGAFYAMLSLTLAAGLSAVVTGSLVVKKDRTIADMVVESDEDWENIRGERDRLALGADLMIGLTAASAISTLVLAFFTDFGKKPAPAVTPEVGAAGSGLTLGLRMNL